MSGGSSTGMMSCHAELAPAQPSWHKPMSAPGLAPLYLDLDGTLLQTDTLQAEADAALAPPAPSGCTDHAGGSRGKSMFKQAVTRAIA